MPESQIVPLLTELYAQPSWKSGRDRLYHRIGQQCLGISRRDVMDFLKRQETWQLHQTIHKPPTRQTVSVNRPLDHWQIDLIDFTAQTTFNNGHRFILTVIDGFTKYAWAKPIKTKHASSVAEAMRNVFDDHVLHNRLPKIIQSDNGGEFKDEVSRLLAERGIKQIFSEPFKPTTQGLIERFNGTLKRARHLSAHDTVRHQEVERCRG